MYEIQHKILNFAVICKVASFQFVISIPTKMNIER